FDELFHWALLANDPVAHVNATASVCRAGVRQPDSTESSGSVRTRVQLTLKPVLHRVPAIVPSTEEFVQQRRLAAHHATTTREPFQRQRGSLEDSSTGCKCQQFR